MKLPFRSPRANSICERFVSTCRREVLDHLLIFSARHLEAVIKEFLVHYHQARPHQGLDQRCPAPAAQRRPAPNAWPNRLPRPPGRVTARVRMGRVIDLTEAALRHTMLVACVGVRFRV